MPLNIKLDMKLVDNLIKRLGYDLKETIRKGSKLSITASTFSIYAYEAFKKELEKIDELRFIFSSTNNYYTIPAIQ